MCGQCNRSVWCCVGSLKGKVMKSKIYINLIFGVVAFVIGLVYFINHEQRIGKFIILVAVCAEIRALVTWYLYKSKNSRLSKE